jgi:hypothetical protein
LKVDQQGLKAIEKAWGVTVASQSSNFLSLPTPSILYPCGDAARYTYIPIKGFKICLDENIAA